MKKAVRLIALAFGCMLAASCASAPKASQSLMTVKETQASLPGFNIYRPADMKAAGRRLPIISWINGGCVRMDSPWTTMLERWASAGYFVVAVTTPAGANAAAPGQSTVADQKAAIDWAIKQNASLDSPYAGRLDVDRIVAAGNSCGGMSSLTLASTDARVKSVFVLSGSSVGPTPAAGAAEAVMSKVTAPVAFIVGGTEDMARIPANTDCSLLRTGIPCLVVQRSSGDHRTVSTDTAIQSVAADVAVNWFKATLYNDRAATETLQGKICAQCDAATWSANRKNLGAR